MSSVQITVPEVTLTLDQLLAAIRQLDDDALDEVTRTIWAIHHDARLSTLMHRLSQRHLDDDLSDAEIAAEVRAVREARAADYHAPTGN